MTMNIHEACSSLLETLRQENAQMGLRELQRSVLHAQVIEALKANRGNQVRTARQLRVHRNTLSRYLREIAAAGYPDVVSSAKNKPAHSAGRAKAAA